MVGCAAPRRKRRTPEDLGGRVRARRRFLKVQSAGCWQEPARPGWRRPLKGAGLSEPVSVEGQLDLIWELAAQADELREDHYALCDCLCAVGVLTPGEIDLQRQLRARTDRFRRICASPVLVGRIASFTAAGPFGVASRAAAAALRATLLVAGGPEIELGRSPRAPPHALIPAAQERLEGARCGLDGAQLDAARKGQASTQPDPEPPSVAAEPTPRAGFTAGLFRRLFMASEAPAAEASRPADGTAATAPPGAPEAPPAPPAPPTDPPVEPVAAEPAAEPAAAEPATAEPAAERPTGTTSRFFGGLFAGGAAAATADSSGAASSPPAGAAEAEPPEAPAPDPQPEAAGAGSSEAVAGAGSQTEPQQAAPDRPAETEDSSPAAAAPPASPVGDKDKAPLASQRGGTARFLGRLLGYGSAAERPLPLVYPVLEVGEIICAVGRCAGATAARQLCEVSKAASESLRSLLPELREQAPFIYVCGGSCGIAMDPTERFSLVTGCWEALPSMLMPRRACAAASAGGRFYVMGGVDVPRFNASSFGESLPLPSNSDDGVVLDRYRPECYDPATNSWELLPPLNRPFTHAAAAAIGGSVYVFGGLSFGGVLDQAQCYDPARQRWECLPPMPTPRFECSAAPVSGKLYVVGGANIQGEPLAVAECFDPRLGQWKSLAPMFQARYGCAAAAARGRVHVFGGHGAWEDLAEAEVYEPEAGLWVSLEPMSVRRNHCGAATARGRIYVFGGHAEGQDVVTVDCLDPESGEWEVAARMPQPRSHCMTVAVLP